MTGRVFYLHGGPGFSTVFERERFPDARHVHWWQQPPAAPRSMRPYQDLQDAALDEFGRFVSAHAAPQPVTVLASSFGAQLALHLARHAPQSIGRIVLLAPTWNPELSLLRLARRVLARPVLALRASHALTKALAAHARTPDRTRFWDVMAALWQIPDVPLMYFAPEAEQAAQRFLQLLAQPGNFDARSSAAISDDFAALGSEPVRHSFAGPVSILFGAHDPLAAPATDGPIWRTIFPQAELRMAPSGHFPLLEGSLEDCLK